MRCPGGQDRLPKAAPLSGGGREESVWVQAGVLGMASD